MRTQSRSRWPVVVAGLTILAAIGVTAVVSMRTSPPSQSVSPIVESSPDLDGLLARIARIEQRLDALENPTFRPLRTRADSPGTEQELIEGDFAEPGPAELLERVARLEEIEVRRQEAQRQRAEQRRAIEEARRVERAQVAAAAVTLMIDPTVDDMAKMQAWGNMRMNARETWTDEIVTEAVRIGTTAEDGQVRADIWRQAHANHTHPMLLQPLLQAVASDPHPSAREEAAETLDLYLDQPGVREALQFAADYDENPGVRRQATVSLAGPTTGGF